MTQTEGWAYTLPLDLSNALYDAIYFDGETEIRSAISNIIVWILEKVPEVDLQEITNLQTAVACETEDINTCLTTLYDISDKYSINLGLDDNGPWYEISCINPNLNMDSTPIEYIREAELENYCDNLKCTGYLEQSLPPEGEIRYWKAEETGGFTVIILKYTEQLPEMLGDVDDNT